MSVKTILTEFAKYLGEQDKEILAQVDRKLNELKNDLLGGAGEEFDTLKELADSITNIKDGSTSGAELLTKITEFKSVLDTIKSQYDELESTDLKAAYAKGKGQA